VLCFGQRGSVLVALDMGKVSLMEASLIALSVSAENDAHDSVRLLQGLEKRGHNVTAFPWGAVVQLILVDPDTGNFTAISDPRKDGAPAAY